MRIKVAYRSEKLVIPIGPLYKTERVEALLQFITERFKQHLGTTSETFRFVQLKTADNFLINPHDKICEVIEQGDTLSVVDYEDFIKDQYPLLSKRWLKIAQSDFNSSELVKWLDIGFHNLNKVYLLFGIGYDKTQKLLRLELFDKGALRDYAKPGKKLIGRSEGRSKNGDLWFIEAHLIIEGDTVIAIEGAVKSSSDPQAKIQRIEIDSSRNLIEPGPITSVQKHYVTVKKSYSVTTPISQGPTFDPKDILSPGESKVAPNPENYQGRDKCTGNSTLCMDQIDEVYADQSFKRDGKFDNIFYCEFYVQNTSDEPLSIVRAKSEYQTEDGWIVAQNTFLGSKSGYYNYGLRRETVYNWQIDKKSPQKIAVGSYFQIEGPQYDRMRRAYKTFPTPLNIRITLEDSNKQTKSLTVTYQNPKLSVCTSASRIKDNSDKGTLVWWLECDDLNVGVRLYIEGFLSPDKTYISIADGSGRSIYIYRSTLRRWAWDATRENKTEYKLEVPCINIDDGNFTSEGYALVDLETSWVYGVKLRLKTTTSSVEKSFLIPDELVEVDD